jgi:S-formylglutathione hydrolase FrmB
MNRIAGGWSVQSVAGHECEVFAPARPHPEGLVAIYLHGVHQQSLRDKPVFNALFEQHGLRVVAPLTGESWWTDRVCEAFDATITPERYVIDSVAPFIADTFGAVPPKIGLFGTSMGGQGALRFGFKHPQRFPVVVGISPAIDYQLRFREGDPALGRMYRDAEQVRQDTATLHVHPFSWPRHTWFCCDPTDARWWESADRLRMKLRAVGVPHECDLETSGGGHGFEYYERMAPTAIGFLVERLERELRRAV